MQINKKLFTIAISALLLISMLALAAPALAIGGAPTLTPSTGAVGTKVTVTGTGASAGGVVTLYWDLLASTPLNTTTAQGDGSYTCQVTIPDAKIGTHYVIAQDSAGSVGAAFAVIPKVSLSGNSGIPGDSITVTGTGFNSTSNVTIIFSNATYTRNVTPALTNTTANGAFSLAITVPTVAYGSYNITALDANLNGAFAAFTVGASITLSPTSGPTGTLVTVTGRGFAHAVNNIIITLNQTATFTLGANTTTIKTVADGTFTGAFVVPSIANGAATVSATDGVQTATATFTVRGVTSLTASPTSSSPSGIIVLTGSNFTAVAGTAVTVYFAAFPYTLSTNATGGFNQSITLPSLTPGIYSITATDARGLNATIATYQLAVTTLTATPTQGPVGTAVTVTGYGFGASVAFNVTLNNVLVATGTTGATTAVATFNVPTVAVGTKTLKLTEIASGLTASTTITVNATTTLVANPTTAPVNVNVAVTLTNFGPSTTAYLYIQNSTYSLALSSASTNSSGALVGTFTVPTLANGAYTLVANDTTNTWNATAAFTVGSATFNAGPRASIYAQSDIISFNLQSTFADDVIVWIVDPQGTPSALNYASSWFIQSGTLYVMPYALSNYAAYTGDTFGMQLPADAVTGTWKWNATLVTLGTTKNGTFSVVASAAASNITNTQLNDAIKALQTDVTGLKSSVSGIQTSVGSSLSSQISSMQSQLTAIQNGIATITTPDLGPITTSLAAISAKLDSVSGDTATIKSSVGDLTTSLASINTKVTSIEGKVATISTDLGTLTGTVTSINGNVATIQTAIGTIQADISGLKTSVGGLQTDVTGVKSDVSTAKNSTESLSPMIIVAIVLALIAAIAAIASIVLMRRKIAG